MLIVNEKEFHRAREVADLKNQLDRSHEGYTTSVEEFCKSLDQDSPRYQEYMLQLNARTVELVNLRARLAEFMLKGIEERSATASNKFRGTVRFRKEILSGCGGTVKSNYTVSSASKLRLEVKLAEMRLQQAESAARLQSQQMVLQAETVLLEARIRAEVMEEQVFEEPADVQPEKALHDKVDDYLQSLPPSGTPALECRSLAFLQMAHSTPDALAHDLPSHYEVNSSLSFPPPVISVSSPGDSNPGASNSNVQAESWQPQSSNAVGVETLASHGPAIADLGRPPVCPSQPSFFFQNRCSLAAPYSVQLRLVLNYRLSLEITLSLVMSPFRLLLTHSPKLPPLYLHFLRSTPRLIPRLVWRPVLQRFTLITLCLMGRPLLQLSNRLSKLLGTLLRTQNGCILSLDLRRE